MPESPALVIPAPAPAPAAPPAAAPAAPVDRLQPVKGLAGVYASALARARTTAQAQPPAIGPDPLSAPAPSAAAPPAAAQAAPEPAKAEIAADPAAVKQWAHLTKTIRELETKLKTLEPAQAEAATLAAARKLYSEGKRIDAVALLANAKDATAEMETLMADYLRGGTAAEAITVEQLAKRLDDEKAAEKKAADEKAAEDKAAAAAATEAANLKNATEYVARVLDDPAMAAKFERCARPANRDEAAAEATKQVADALAAQGLTPEKMTPELTRTLIEAAYAAIEVEYDAKAAEAIARYSKGTLQTPATVPGSDVLPREDASIWSTAKSQSPAPSPAPMTDANLPRPGVVPQPPRRFYSHTEAAERARQAARGR